MRRAAAPARRVRLAAAMPVSRVQQMWCAEQALALPAVRQSQASFTSEAGQGCSAGTGRRKAARRPAVPARQAMRAAVAARPGRSAPGLPCAPSAGLPSAARPARTRLSELAQQLQQRCLVKHGRASESELAGTVQQCSRSAVCAFCRAAIGYAACMHQAVRACPAAAALVKTHITQALTQG